MYHHICLQLTISIESLITFKVLVWFIPDMHWHMCFQITILDFKLYHNSCTDKRSLQYVSSCVFVNHYFYWKLYHNLCSDMVSPHFVTIVCSATAILVEITWIACRVVTTVQLSLPLLITILMQLPKALVTNQKFRVVYTFFHSCKLSLKAL